jgi:hypothetical protein
VGDDRGGVVLTGPKDDVRTLRPPPGTDNGGVIDGSGGVIVGVTGAELTGLAVGILIPKASDDLRSALSNGLFGCWNCG